MQSRKAKAKANQGQNTVSKSRINGAGTNHVVTKTSRLMTVGNTGSDGLKIVYATIDPFNTTVTTPAVSGIAASYEYYRIKHCAVEIIPSGGSLATGSVMHGFVNNSEIIAQFPSFGTSTKGNVITDEQGVTICSWAFGGTKTYQQERIASRRWFQNNYVPAGTVADADRTIQTMYVALFRGPADSAVPVSINFHVTFEMAGLGSVGVTTLAAARNLAAYPRVLFPLEEDQDWPAKVELVSRAGSKIYSLGSPEPAPAPKPPLELLLQSLGQAGPSTDS